MEGVLQNVRVRVQIVDGNRFALHTEWMTSYGIAIGAKQQGPAGHHDRHQEGRHS